MNEQVQIFKVKAKVANGNNESISRALCKL